MRTNPYSTLGAVALAMATAGCANRGGGASIQAVAVPDDPGGDIALSVTLADADSLPATLALEVSADNELWNTATLTAGTSLVDLSTSPGGTTHVFTWDSLADLGIRVSGDTWIRITASGAGGLSDIRTIKLARVANLLPAAKRVRDYLVYFGPLDAPKIRTAETHDLVIVDPRDPTVTAAVIADIQNGVDSRDVRDDCIVLGYLNVGEDDRTIGVPDGLLQSDQRFVADGLGPRVDPRGPGAGGQSLAGIDLNGLPSVGGGFASFYLDDNSIDRNGVGDGVPDRNAVTGACYVNAGSPLWLATLHDQRLAQDGQAGIEEMLTKTVGAALGLDGLCLDNVDTCAPNAFTSPADPDHATFEWTAPGVTWFCGEVRRRYRDHVIMQNRGLFFFDPRYEHYHFSTGPIVDFVKLENYRLDRDPSREFDPWAFAENKHSLAPRLNAESQRFSFQVLSLGYASGPGIDPQTLLFNSTAGLQTLQDDVAEAELVGFRHYLTNVDGDLVNDFARSRMIVRDSAAPVWSSTYNDHEFPGPPAAPTPRVGIQQVEVAPGSLTVRWDVALDQSAVTYVIFYDTRPIVFGSSGAPSSATAQELLPARVSTSYAAGPGPFAYPFEATNTGLARNKNYWFCIQARDSAGNWERNRVVLTARTQ